MPDWPVDTVADSSLGQGTIALIGSSIELNEGDPFPLSGGIVSNSLEAHGDGPLQWANAYSGARMQIIKNAALAGQTSTTTLANIQNAANAQYFLGMNPAPGFIWMGHVTGDDPQSLTPVQSVANELAMYNLLRQTYSKATIILPTLPGVLLPASGGRTVADGVTNTTTTITSATAAFVAGDVGRPVTGSADLQAGTYILSVTNGTTAVLNQATTGSHSAQTFTLANGNAAYRWGVNPQRRSLAASTPNTILFDFEREFTDPTTGYASTNWSQDQIHPNPRGAQVVGRAIYNLLVPFLPQSGALVDDYSSDSRVNVAVGTWGIDAMMRGTPGAGVTATNFSFTGPAGATRNLVPRDDLYGNWQECVYGGTAGQLGVSRTGIVALPAAAVYHVECEILFTGTLPDGTITDISLIWGDFTQNLAALGDQLGNRGPYTDPGAGIVVVAKSPPIVIRGGGSTAGSIVQATINGSATSGSICFGRLSLVRDS